MHTELHKIQGQCIMGRIIILKGLERMTSPKTRTFLMMKFPSLQRSCCCCKFILHRLSLNTSLLYTIKLYKKDQSKSMNKSWQIQPRSRSLATMKTREPNSDTSYKSRKPIHDLTDFFNQICIFERPSCHQYYAKNWPKSDGLKFFLETIS